MDENRDEMKDEFGDEFGTEVRKKNTVGLAAILALLVGIVGFLFTFFLPGGVVFGLIAAVVAILLATFSIHRVGKTKVARAGRILGIIGIVVVAIYLVILIVFLQVGF